MKQTISRCGWNERDVGVSFLFHLLLPHLLIRSSEDQSWENENRRNPGVWCLCVYVWEQKVEMENEEVEGREIKKDCQFWLQTCCLIDVIGKSVVSKKDISLLTSRAVGSSEEHLIHLLLQILRWELPVAVLWWIDEMIWFLGHKWSTGGKVVASWVAAIAWTGPPSPQISSVREDKHPLTETREKTIAKSILFSHPFYWWWNAWIISDQPSWLDLEVMI